MITTHTHIIPNDGGHHRKERCSDSRVAGGLWGGDHHRHEGGRGTCCTGHGFGLLKGRESSSWRMRCLSRERSGRTEGRGEIHRAEATLVNLDLPNCQGSHWRVVRD